MSVTITLPSGIERQLQSQWGGSFERKAIEALAVEGYRSGVLSLGEVSEMLDLSINDADGFLKERGIYRGESLDEIDRAGSALEELLTK